MRVRAKFECVSTEPPGDSGYGAQVKLQAVVDGSDENKAFFAATPYGEITLCTVNQAAFEQFEPGRSYYVDFTPAE